MAFLFSRSSKFRREVATAAAGGRRGGPGLTRGTELRKLDTVTVRVGRDYDMAMFTIPTTLSDWIPLASAPSREAAGNL